MFSLVLSFAPKERTYLYFFLRKKVRVCIKTQKVIKHILWNLLYDFREYHLSVHDLLLILSGILEINLP